MTERSDRVNAALEVLRGVAPEDVADRVGVDALLVERWTEQFIEGGRERLSGAGGPSTYEARERFLALVAHEFRTPLAIIGGWADTLLTMDGHTPTTQRGLEVIHHQVGHLGRIASDALDSAAVALHQLRLVLSGLDLRELAGAVADSLSDERLVVGPGPPVSVVGDRARLDQVLGSVMTNALRHAGSLPAAVTLAIAAGHALVEVQSTGVALSFEDARTMFEPFSRPDSSRRAGLGLYVSRALVVAHGGEIGVRSDAEVTTFWFRVPVAGPKLGPLVERSPT